MPPGGSAVTVAGTKVNLKPDGSLMVGNQSIRLGPSNNGNGTGSEGVVFQGAAAEGTRGLGVWGMSALMGIWAVGWVSL